MSNYVKSTDFAAKDALLTGNPAKIIKGTEINDEFNNIQTAVATKADITSPNLLGNPTAPTQAYGNNTTRIATTAFVQAALQALYPIGTIYTSVVSTNPATLFGFGTWVAFASGKTLIGVDVSDTAFATVEKTGGSKNAVVVSHNHTATTVITDPGHLHTDSLYNASDNGVAYATAGSGNSGFPTGGVNSTNTNTTGITAATTVASSGVSGTNANLPPYITVYFWKRTA